MGGSAAADTGWRKLTMDVAPRLGDIREDLAGIRAKLGLVGGRRWSGERLGQGSTPAGKFLMRYAASRVSFHAA